MSDGGKKECRKHVFGPVFSRRLGVSLGIDLVPAKTCPFDCIYCESGRTTFKTTERKSFFPVGEIFSEIEGVLSSGPSLDFLTFSGAGEPTLNADLGRILSFLKEKFPQYRICLITDGLLLGVGGMPEELLPLDLVIPSLDASDEDEFAKINRPADGVSFRGLVESLLAFRRGNRTEMWLEIFLVPGINDSAESVGRFRNLVSRIAPDRVQLNRLDRPGTEYWVEKAGTGILTAFRNALEGVCPVDIPGLPLPGKWTDGGGKRSDLAGEIISLISRRPCTSEELRAALAADENAYARTLDKLVSAGIVSITRMERGDFIVLSPK